MSSGCSGSLQFSGSLQENNYEPRVFASWERNESTELKRVATERQK